MRRFHAVSPIVSAWLCGFWLPELTWAIDSHRGVHSATDLVPWIIVPLAGADAAWGAWRAFKSASPTQEPG